MMKVMRLTSEIPSSKITLYSNGYARSKYLAELLCDEVVTGECELVEASKWILDIFVCTVT